MSVVTILAGGWSAKAVDRHRLPGLVIGVNDAALNVNCGLVLSMDRLWTEYRWHELQRMAQPTYLRRSAVQRVTGFWRGLTVFECDHESTVFSETAGTLNGTHSGFAALNLAYQMRPRRINLVGFDMTRGPKGECYWHNPYPWAPNGATSQKKYSVWAQQFDHAAGALEAAGIEVVNVTPVKSIKVFKRLSPEQFNRENV